MNYQVFARKYRPQTFAEVVGQDHIVRTLENAIRHGRIAQTYLFVGPRGTGKTSLARILAKALNVPGGPTCDFDPNNEVVQEIAEGRSLDVLEIDGASNNGVEQVRDLRDNVRYTPVKGKYKVYIIDEVHMLTGAAFNALLKTLEEPPPHVKFIFATTEVHKLPATILSRCQRFDLRRIPDALIAAHLGLICGKEGVAADPAALQTIARYAEGGLRDAESALDQVVSFYGDRLTEEDVLAQFGLSGLGPIAALAQSILEGDIVEVLRQSRDFITAGKDLAKLSQDLLRFFRNLVIFQVSPQALGGELTPLEISSLENCAPLVTRSGLLAILEELGQLEARLRYALAKDVIFEVALLQLSQLREKVSIESILLQLGGEGSASPAAPRQATAAPRVTRSEVEKPVVAATPRPAAVAVAAAAPVSPPAPIPTPAPLRVAAAAEVSARSPTPVPTSAPMTSSAASAVASPTAVPIPDGLAKPAPSAAFDNLDGEARGLADASPPPRQSAAATPVTPSSSPEAGLDDAPPWDVTPEPVAAQTVSAVASSPAPAAPTEPLETAKSSPEPATPLPGTPEANMGSPFSPSLHVADVQTNVKTPEPVAARAPAAKGIPEKAAEPIAKKPVIREKPTTVPPVSAPEEPKIEARQPVPEPIPAAQVPEPKIQPVAVEEPPAVVFPAVAPAELKAPEAVAPATSRPSAIKAPEAVTSAQSQPSEAKAPVAVVPAKSQPAPSAPSTPVPVASAAAPAPLARSADPESYEDQREDEEESPFARPSGKASGQTAPAVAPVASPKPAPVATPAPSRTSGPATSAIVSQKIENPAAVWRQVVSRFLAEKPEQAEMLNSTRYLNHLADEFEINLPPRFEPKMPYLKSPRNLAALEKHLTDLTGRDYRLVFFLSETKEAGGESAEEGPRVKLDQKEFEDDPLIREALELFEARIVKKK